MIAIDTSALYAIATLEPEEPAFSQAIAKAHAIVGAPTLVELSLALTRLGPARVDAFLSRVLNDGEVRPVEFTPAMVSAARDAFRRYGKGQGHPAQLNFGDCLSYAVAKTYGVPLLFKGEDFALTDIQPAHLR